MNNVHNFPTKAIRDWIEISKLVLEMAEKIGLTKDEKNILITRIKPFYELLQIEIRFSLDAFPFSEEIKNQLDEFAKELQERSNKLLFDRIKREIEIINMENYIKS